MKNKIFLKQVKEDGLSRFWYLGLFGEEEIIFYKGFAKDFVIKSKHLDDINYAQDIIDWC